jgi:hypothetical protein
MEYTEAADSNPVAGQRISTMCRDGKQLDAE